MSARFDPALLPPAPDLSFEQPLWAAGLSGVAGIDEAGRGPLAGPVAAAVVVFPPNAGLTVELAGVRDSKQMTPSQRQAACPRIQAAALGFALGFAEAAEIDNLGILPATRLAAWRALQALPFAPDHLLLDALFLPDVDLPQTALIKGDRRSLSIAAASVLAKTARDARLEALEQEYPGYGFARHKGYGTAAHRVALQQLGPCPQHRRSFHIKSLTGLTCL
jgi:ribonuclease HII